MGEREKRLDLGWDLLEQGEFHGAARAAEALLAEEPEDLEALFLAGSALLEVGRVDDATARLESALSLEPDNRSARLTLAAAHYEACRFDKGLDEIRKVLEADDSDPSVHFLQGLLLDMMGLHRKADDAFRKATQRDPDRYPEPLSISAAEFDSVVTSALESLPEEFRVRVEELPVVVQEIPSAAILDAFDEPAPDILGLFVGTPPTERTHDTIPSVPDAVYLFKRNLERACADREELLEEIRVTLLHEIGHSLGMEEDDLEAAGYA